MACGRDTHGGGAGAGYDGGGAGAGYDGGGAGAGELPYAPPLLPGRAVASPKARARR